MKKITHIGVEKGIAYNRGLDSFMELRETKNYWITKYGRKYSKQNGRWVGERFPTFELDISTIKELNEN